MENEITRSMFPIGRISYKSICEFIMDKKIRQTESIQIHPHDFDELALEYREFHKISMRSGVKILGIKIEVQSYGIPRRNVQVTSVVGKVKKTRRFG